MSNLAAKRAHRRVALRRHGRQDLRDQRLNRCRVLDGVSLRRLDAAFDGALQLMHGSVLFGKVWLLGAIALVAYECNTGFA